ncbi:MAG: hypothetical protein KY391_05590 [Actinobacteria bacterium]|nr:hypothetical protein [Actinomycetota bacterium]
MAQPPSVIDGELGDCREIPPHELPPPAIDVSKVIPLEARVLVERGDRAAAQKLFAVTKRAFSDIGIRVKTRFQEVDPPRQWGDGDGLGTGPNQEAILTFMKDLFGGRRPDGVDIVYFMTRHWAGGFADCIGGVRYADRAFAFGSIDYSFEGVIPAPTADEGVIAAHEIGHLLGAHHHYSNCVEALPQGAPRGDLNPCTTMSPFAATASGTFALLERSFIRRYAALYGNG